MTNAGIIDLACQSSVAGTARRLAALLPTKGFKVFATIDQAAEAQGVGLALRPMVLLIFGDPRGGTPLMIRSPSLALDLPLKALIWESADGKVWLSYNAPDYLQRRHGLAAPPFEPVGAVLQAVAAGLP